MTDTLTETGLLPQQGAHHASYGSFEAAEVTTAGMRDLETALALATHQCAALAAGVEATIGQAIADLTAAVANAELRLEAAAARAVELIEAASS